METTSSTLSRSEKILVFMCEHGKGKSVKIRYEDIVVGVFKKYPQDFNLKGYPEYPDSGDTIHKPLYDFKKRGYINAASKIFSLTDRGIELAAQLSQGKTPPTSSNGRLSRSAETETARVRSLEGLDLYIKGEKEKLSDNDFYSYLGVTVRTQKNAFKGRLETMSAIIEELKDREPEPSFSKIIGYHQFLISRNKDIIDFFTQE